MYVVCCVREQVSQKEGVVVSEEPAVANDDVVCAVGLTKTALRQRKDWQQRNLKS